MPAVPATGRWPQHVVSNRAAAATVIGAARVPVGSGRNECEDLSSHRSPASKLHVNCRWDDAAIDVPDDDNVFREQLELTPQERVRSTALLELLCNTSL
jgi:hypothetical protein